MLNDGRTYVEAEIAFQKTRLSLAANRSKSGIIYVLGALALLHLALIALVIGAVISLIEWLGPVGATCAVVGTLLVGVAIMLWLARDKFKNLANAFKDNPPADTL
ncbi:phage holin family protein [Pontixanthobacter sp.]|uniref:phage holin family protein n=1 Tax=Pontixanthobacter sp. TaxID=2792078 RepID=UPI003C7AFB29